MVILSEGALELFRMILLSDPLAEFDKRIFSLHGEVSLEILSRHIYSAAILNLLRFAKQYSIKNFSKETILEVFSLDFHIMHAKEMIENPLYRKVLIKKRGLDLEHFKNEYFFAHIANPLVVTEINSKERIGQIGAVYQNQSLTIKVEGLFLPRDLKVRAGDFVCSHFNLVVASLTKDEKDYILREQHTNQVLHHYYQPLKTIYYQDSLDNFKLTQLTKKRLASLG